MTPRHTSGRGRIGRARWVLLALASLVGVLGWSHADDGRNVRPRTERSVTEARRSESERRLRERDRKVVEEQERRAAEDRQRRDRDRRHTEGTDRTAVADSGHDMIRVYRVEGTPNSRLLIDGYGHVAILEPERTLFLNFGDQARAEQYLAQKLDPRKQKLGPLDEAAIKSFDVPRSFLDGLRASAVPEALAGQHPDRPIVVDINQGADQFGLRPEQIRELQRVILQGSGRKGGK